MLSEKERLYLYTDLIYRHFNVLLLSNSETALLINRSTVTLGRWREQGDGPMYKKDEDGSVNAPVFYPIDVVAAFVISNNIKTTMSLPNG